jgi:glucose-6-phosphate dehydrogenase assembly protein OpcA
MASADALSGRSDAVWSAQGTTPDAIEAALRELLVKVHSENDDFLPARVLNMIAFVDREWTGEIANRLRGVGRYHASRLVVLAYEPNRESLDARVMIAAEGATAPGELALLHETVVVELGDRHLGDLLTIADPLVVTDLPTLLWSPHGHHEIVTELLALSQAVLLDSVEEPVAREALDRACALSERAYVVDLAWLRTTPWRERVAAMFDPAWLRRELQAISAVTVRHHPTSTAAATLLVGWLASRLGWRSGSLRGDGDALVGSTQGAGHDVAVRLEAAPDLQVPGLEDLTLETGSGLQLRLSRGRGGLRAHRRWPASEDRPDGEEREWTLMGASRGETGVLGEGIRQALLRDPTYVPALRAARAMLS